MLLSNLGKFLGVSDKLVGITPFVASAGEGRYDSRAFNRSSRISGLDIYKDLLKMTGGIQKLAKKENIENELHALGGLLHLSLMAKPPGLSSRTKNDQVAPKIPIEFKWVNGKKIEILKSYKDYGREFFTGLYCELQRYQNTLSKADLAFYPVQFNNEIEKAKHQLLYLNQLRDSPVQYFKSLKTKKNENLLLLNTSLGLKNTNHILNLAAKDLLQAGLKDSGKRLDSIKRNNRGLAVKNSKA